MQDWLLANWSILGQFGFWGALAAGGTLVVYAPLAPSPPLQLCMPSMFRAQ